MQIHSLVEITELKKSLTIFLSLESEHVISMITGPVFGVSRITTQNVSAVLDYPIQCWLSEIKAALGNFLICFFFFRIMWPHSFLA